MYPEDPTVGEFCKFLLAHFILYGADRRPALQSILSTLLHTYSNFLSSIIAPPVPPNQDAPPDWERLLDWMRIMGQNIIGAANDLRPVQVCLVPHSFGVRNLIVLGIGES